ncbi:MAG: Rad52/Rad22 family DNA repair protein, partial [Nitrososphaerales archaeon]
MSFTKEQVEQLLQPIKPGRVLRANDQSHVPAFDVAAHLTRIFGYGGWDTENLSYTLVAEDGDVRTRTKDGKTQTYKVWTVAYVASITLVVKNADGFAIAHWSNGAGGDAVNQPSRGDAHHLAMTTAISTALKRCAAFGLGDQFGLSLYNKGSQSALVKTSLVVPEGVVFATKPKDVQENSQTPQSLGNDEREGQQPDDNSPSAVTGSQQGSE